MVVARGKGWENVSAINGGEVACNAIDHRLHGRISASSVPFGYCCYQSTIIIPENLRRQNNSNYCLLGPWLWWIWSLPCNVFLRRLPISEVDIDRVLMGCAESIVVTVVGCFVQECHTCVFFEPSRSMGYIDYLSWNIAGSNVKNWIIDDFLECGSVVDVLGRPVEGFRIVNDIVGVNHVVMLFWHENYCYLKPRVFAKPDHHRAYQTQC